MSSSVVLEIGCHEGTATNIISKRSAAVVGIDVDKSVVRVAKARYPCLRFEVCDGGSVQECLALLQGLEPNVITIDVSGQAPLSLALPILYTWVQRCPKALIVIKNRRLYRALAFGQVDDSEEMGGELKSMMKYLLPLCEVFTRTDLNQEELERTEEAKKQSPKPSNP